MASICEQPNMLLHLSSMGIMGGCLFSVMTVQEYVASPDFKSMCDELTSFNGAAPLPKPLNLPVPPH